MKIENYKFEGDILNIQTYPEPVLLKVAEPITEFNAELELLVKNMLFTMYHAPGIGLAAPQIGKSIRLFVLDVDYDRDEILEGEEVVGHDYSNFSPMVFINPEIVGTSGETIYKEGCLSVPGVYEEVNRFKEINVSYQDMKGNKHSIDADELLSICIQHENDHLNGIVFLERLSQLKKKFLKKQFLKDKN
jgi:peptide deformylase